MGKLTKLTKNLIEFIDNQKIFFVATADSTGPINLSPKGMDSFRVVDSKTILWLNLTGSGNETAAHVLDNGRMTIMFCAFDGKPLILRLYGSARMIQRNHSDWDSYAQKFPDFNGTRQIFEVSIEMVQTSCGMAVPHMKFINERNDLELWAHKKGREGINSYWKQKNSKSLSGLATGIEEQSF